MLSMAYLFNDKKFGFISTVGATLIIINMATSIIPNPWLYPTIPFYLFTMAPIVFCDLILKISANQKYLYFAAGIFGMLEYFIYYPLITHVYNEIVANQVVSASVTSKIYFDMILSVFPVIAIPGIMMGMLGMWFCSKISQSMPKSAHNYLEL
jgi:hypothetical protein